MNSPTLDNDTGRKAFQRRAIATALTSFLDDEQLLRALWQWEQHASSGPALALNYFIRLLADTYDLQEQQRKLHRDLITALAQPADNLLPDPWPRMVAYRNHHYRTQTPATTPALPIPAQTLVFKSLLQRFLAALALAAPEQITALREQLALYCLQQPDCSDACREELAAWLCQGRARLTLNYPLVGLRGVLNHVYVLVCTLLGPVKADQLLATSLTETETLAESRQFNPRKLL